MNFKALLATTALALTAFAIPAQAGNQKTCQFNNEAPMACTVQGKQVRLSITWADGIKDSYREVRENTMRDGRGGIWNVSLSGNATVLSHANGNTITIR